METLYTKRHEKCLPNGEEMWVEICEAFDPWNPLDDEGAVHIACLKHPRHVLGHEQLDEDAMEELRQRLLDGEMAAYLPVYMLDHGSVYLNTESYRCPWDSDLIGWAYITREKTQELQLPDEPGARTKFLNDCIRETVQQYGHYVAGDCWDITVFLGEDQIDGGVSFVGDLSDAEKEANTLLENCFKHEEQSQAENRKYRLEPEGKGFRIYALKNIPEHGVKTGNKGGVIAFDEQLSHEGACWVAEGAQLRNNARVFDDALVSGTTVLSSGEQVGGNGLVSSNRHVVVVSATGLEPINVCVYPNKSTLLATVNGYTDTVTQWKHISDDPVVNALIVAAEKLLEEVNE